MRRASDGYSSISSPPHRVLLYCCGRLKLSYGPVLQVLPVLLVLLWSSQAVRRPRPPGTALLIYCWYCRFCCGRLKLSDGRILLVLLYCWYCLIAGVTGSAVLLRSSQAVRRPRPPATALLLVLLVLLDCRGNWFCCTAAAVSSCPTTTPSGYCFTAGVAGTAVLLYCCGRLKLSDDHALRLLLYCWHFFTAVAVSSCPTAGYCHAGFPRKEATAASSIWG
ncbi:hypothetical protein E9229_001882 [Paeniglutamicibacter cryotolerans]|uniref:Uncharacterized protein n=1 Tax=Paeniglutamicibacter cryotolerans TaxID=670079 RepID=A0A839QUJ9_9MICC|nr:hypothetical protein [Paeniglutamicibacter cryotolerans]